MGRQIKISDHMLTKHYHHHRPLGDKIRTKNITLRYTGTDPLMHYSHDLRGKHKLPSRPVNTRFSIRLSNRFSRGMDKRISKYNYNNPCCDDDDTDGPVPEKPEIYGRRYLRKIMSMIKGRR